MISKPPIFWQALVQVFAHAAEESYILGDLEETYASVEADYGKTRARAWYRRQVILSIPHLAARFVVFGIVMSKNYLLIALRNLRKSLGYTSINMFGLAVGLTCSLLIGLYVVSEISFDTHHEKANRIVRLVRTSNFGGGENTSPATSGPMGPLFASGLPEIESFFRLRQRPSVEVTRDGNVWYEEGFYDADASIFKSLTIPVLSSVGEGALEAPFRIMLSRTAALKFFNSVDITGQTLTVRGTEYAVDGVYEDFPLQSHFRPLMMGSFATLEQTIPETVQHLGNNLFFTYFLLKSPNALEEAQSKIPALIEQTAGPEIASKLAFSFQPLLDIHLYSHYVDELDVNSSVTSLVLISAIGFFILILAIVNFINLSTARSTRRAREVGVRKAIGAHRMQIAAQFIAETMMLSFLALGASLLMFWGVRPLFEEVTGRTLDVLLLRDPIILGAIALFTSLVGLAAGAYPAFVISSFVPTIVLKGSTSGRNEGGNQFLRKGLVVFQFSISVVLIISTMMVWRQLDYLRSKSLGIDSGQVLVTRLRNTTVREAAAALKSEFLQDASVSGVSATSSLLGNEGGTVLMVPEGTQNAEDGIIMNTMHADFDFVDLMGIQVLEGRSFDESQATDLEDAYLINERAAEKMGWTAQEAIGKEIIWPSSIDGSTPPVRVGTVIGVMKDFNFASLHTVVEPLVLIPSVAPPAYLMVKLSTTDLPATLSRLENTWETVVPKNSFDSFFLDDHFDQLYQSEERFGTMFAYFAVLAIVLACLGLLGLVSFTLDRRTREIGIRKTLGASSSSIIKMLTQEYALLIGISLVVAIPTAFLLMDRWLEGFPYRTDQSIAVFLTAALSIICISLVTIGFHAIRAASMDPVHALRHE
ncbi:MAG: ABC transporter permease [Bacteroidetes bacterium]|nr:ABC transporter permease [Bacteroidota bacterium]